MASIRDVSRMAGVSTATVSKHLNKTGYVSPEKREAIGRAIEALHYAPNRSARQLKTNVSREVLFVVPNMTENIYREVMRGVDAALGGAYRLVIQLTNDSAERETSILRECLNNATAGVLLCTCNPAATGLFKRLSERVPLVFLLRKPAGAQGLSYLGFNQFDAIYSLATELFALGFQDIGLFTGDSAFSNEAECTEAFLAAFEGAGRKLTNNRLFSFPFSREETFRSIMHLFDTGDYPRVFLTTSYQSARAINEVAYFRNLELGRDLFLFALGEDSWYNNMFDNKVVCTFRDAQKLGALAAQALLDQIASPQVFEPVNFNLEDGFAFHKVSEYVDRLKRNAPPAAKTAYKSRLVVLFNATDTGTDALKSLIPQFEKRAGVQVDFRLLPHHELYEALLDCAKSRSHEIDLFSVDAPWLPYLDQLGLFTDLTEFMRGGELPAQFAPSVLENIATLDRRILGVPYVYSLQMLFFRKDLFTDPAIMSEFHRRYGVRLEPPRTWHLFNLIAGFFTRRENPSSPTEYGTSIFGGNFPAAMCSELFPRVWGYNGSIFDKRGHVLLYSRENLRAYECLAQTIRFCPQDILGANLFHGVRQLLAGDTAMCVFFSTNASLLADSTRNPLRNQLGFAPIPSRKPVFSGWDIAVNRYSRHADKAFDFLRWFSSMGISSAYSILGGSAPMTALLEHEPLLQIYPWTTLARQEYHTSAPRAVPRVPGAPLLDEMVVENFMSGVMFDYLKGKGTLERLLYDAHMRLCRYAEENGYPQNIPPKPISG